MKGWGYPRRDSAAARLLPILTACAAFLQPNGAGAQGHGPIYGLSTPTLGQGGWSLDIGAMGRFGEGRRAVMTRPMLGYGVTEDVQLFASVPVPIQRAEGLPTARAFTRMSAQRDLELGVGWRPQRRGLGVGTRQETTVWLGLSQPMDDGRAGIATSPGAFGAVVTGYASRTVYAWLGGAHRRYAGRDGDRSGDVTMGSLVLGYRPPAFRGDYPSADWRGFLELVGEWMDEDRLGGRAVPGSGGRQVFLAATVLGLYGSWGLAAGPALPLTQDVVGAEEGLRLAVNVTFWW